MLRTLATVLVTAILVSAFWIFYLGMSRDPASDDGGRVVAGSDGEIVTAGQKITVDPEGRSPITIAEGLWVGPAGLAVPVQGISPQQLVDTFTQARAGGARRHDAIDIMAPEGTPVIAAADGTVEKLYLSDGGGGITAYVRSPDSRWSYYYAHLHSYAPGLAEGQQVRRGQLIGRVGHTGNANPAGPHLHFAINRMEPDEKWYEGSPVNPYPLLAGKKASG